MRRPKDYCTHLEAWATQLGLGGKPVRHKARQGPRVDWTLLLTSEGLVATVGLAYRPVYVLIKGPPESSTEWMRRLRTEKVRCWSCVERPR
jgi:hypothetical protein